MSAAGFHQEHYDGEPPFARPAGSDASMFIQWKGTDACIDFTCGACNENCHFDGYFAHYLRCPCGAVYEMGTQVIARRVTDESAAGLVQDLIRNWPGVEG